MGLCGWVRAVAETTPAWPFSLCKPSLRWSSCFSVFSIRSYAEDGGGSLGYPLSNLVLKQVDALATRKMGSQCIG